MSSQVCDIPYFECPEGGCSPNSLAQVKFESPGLFVTLNTPFNVTITNADSYPRQGYDLYYRMFKPGQTNEENWQSLKSIPRGALNETTILGGLLNAGTYELLALADGIDALKIYPFAKKSNCSYPNGWPAPLTTQLKALAPRVIETYANKIPPKTSSSASKVGSVVQQVMALAMIALL